MERSSNFKKYEKVVIFGDDEVGKTSIIKRLSGNQLEFNYEKIKGIKSNIIQLSSKDDVFNVNFFEVNLNENISSILETLLLGCRTVIFVYDLASEISFTKVMRLVSKIDEIANISAHLMKIIIGNKTDLKDDKKYAYDLQFDRSELEKLSGSDNYEIIEMSTLTNDNLHVLKKLLVGVLDDRESENDSILFEELDGFSKPNSKAESTLNIMLLGEPRVGKTSFFGKFFDNDRAEENYLVTVGVDKRSKLIKIGSTFYNLQIWDTAGQEVYQSITKSFYKKSDGLFLLFDVTDENSFLKVEKWMKEIETNANKDTVVYLVGNKIDCIDLRAVEREKAQNIAKSINKKYYEISAKLGINLKEAVFSIVKDILKKKDFNSIDPIHIINGDRHDLRDNASSSCCAGNNNKGSKKKH